MTKAFEGQHHGHEWGSANPELRLIGDTYHLYYHGSPQLEDYPRMQTPNLPRGIAQKSGICLARCKVSDFDGFHWDWYEHNPIVRWGEEGAFDASHIYDPSTAYFKGKYWMYYSTLGPGPDGEDEFNLMGMASSGDGLHWTKHPEPVMGGRGPEALVHDDVLYIFNSKDHGESMNAAPHGKRSYWKGGWFNITLGKSTDGIHFTPQEDQPLVLPHGRGGEWDSHSVAAPTIWREDDWWYMLYVGDHKHHDAHEGFGLARSKDLYEWEKNPGNPIFLPSYDRDACDGEMVFWPEILKKAGKYYLWYEGIGYPSLPEGRVARIALATLEADSIWEGI